MRATKTKRQRAAVRPRPQPTRQKTDPTPGTKHRNVSWIAILLPLALGLLVYARTVTYGLSYLDDTTIKDEQPFLSNIGNVIAAFRHLYLGGTSYYRPLVTVSYILDAQWTGANPFGYHLTNVALHLIATALVYALLNRLRFTSLVSAFSASIFAIHPALVETVAWIPGRNDSLFAIFALSAWVFLALDVERPLVSLRVAHIAFLTAALFTKETAVVLPCLFAVYLWSVGLGATVLISRRLWPLWLLSVVSYGIVRSTVVASPQGAFVETGQALLQQFPVLLSSLGKLCLPVQLSPLATARDTAAWPGVAAMALIAGLVVVARSQRKRVLLLAASTFFLPLIPTLLVAERLALENRLYLPAVGFCIFIAEMARALLLFRPRMVAPICGCLLAGMLVTTWSYAGAYRDRGALSEVAVSLSPNSALAHLHRGDFYYAVNHDLDDAETEYRRAIELDAHELIVHNNLAVLLMDRKQFQEAEALLTVELAMNPSYAPAHYNLGLALRNLNRLDEAANEWEQALRNDPDHVNSMGELMVYYAMRGDQVKAAYYKDQMSQKGVKFTQAPALAP